VSDWEVWEIRNPDGAALGLEVARGRMAPHRQVLAHALPSRVDIWIYDSKGHLVAEAQDLEDRTPRPMSRLLVRGRTITRENVWPGPEDLGLPVILPGGEVGILKEWWNAEDGSEWRWVIELHNRRSVD
jgi:hypothetical protein